MRPPTQREAAYSTAYALAGMVEFIWIAAVAIGAGTPILIAAAVGYPLGRAAMIPASRYMTSRAAIWATSVAGALAASATWWLPTTVAVVVVSGFILSAATGTVFVASQARVPATQLVALAPLAMAGGLFGLCAVTWWPGPHAALGLVVVGSLALAACTQPLTGDSAPRRAWAWPLPASVSLDGLAVPLASFGPVVVAAVLTATWFGPGWVPGQHGAYMLGGFTAGWVTRRLPASRAVISFCSLAGVGVWVLALAGPVGMVCARFLSAGALFTAQGRLQIEATEGLAGTRRAAALAGVTLTLAAGTALSGAWTGAVSSHGPGVIAGVGVLLATPLVVTHLLSSRRAGAHASGRGA